MSIGLFSDAHLVAEQVGAAGEAGYVVVLHAASGGLAAHLQTALADPDRLIIADVRTNQLSRINFDAVACVVLDLTVEELLSSAGRRLVDVLGRLAQEELLLAFVGEAASQTGTLLADGVTAGLNLIPRTVILMDVAEAQKLHALLATVRDAGLRILACDGPIGVVYRHDQDGVSVRGGGSVMVGALAEAAPGGEQKVRLQVLTHGMTSGWPA